LRRNGVIIVMALRSHRRGLMPLSTAFLIQVKDLESKGG
jgi:hypothetical protein